MRPSGSRRPILPSKRLKAQIVEIYSPSPCFQTLLSTNDNVFDASGMFVSETKEIKCSFALILKALSIVFSWSGFEDAINEELFVGNAF